MEALHANSLVSPDARSLTLHLQNLDSIVVQATVTVPAALINTLYHETSLLQKEHIQAHGFSKGQVPLEYVAEHFKGPILEHIKEFLLKYCVLDFLLQETAKQKLLMVGNPRLAAITITPDKPALFTFEISHFSPTTINEWKYLPFKAPKRKNYKDLDRQVEAFIEEERKFLTATNGAQEVMIGDWVHCTITLVTAQQKPLLDSYTTSIWLKLGNEEADSTFHELFLGKSQGDAFYTNNKGLQEYFGTHLDAQYTFLVRIVDVLKGSYFCLEQFKKYFKIKTNKELYQKLIEVFSFRNDISLRRSIAEEALKLLLSKHKFLVPSYLALRQQKIILDKVQHNPDYHVYRVQKDFQERVRQLAEKQIREMVLLDLMTHHEELIAEDQEIKGYLNFTTRPRMKDFLYFDSPNTKINGQEIPLATEELKRFYLREKALNHIIYHLTKQ